MTKPFSWSWSKYKNYRVCPKRHYEVDIAKTYQEKEGEQLKWGNQVHGAMAQRLKKGEPLPVTMKHYGDWPDNIERMWKGGKGAVKLLVEQKLAISANFEATGYFAPETWFRAVVDVGLLIPSAATAITIDWKTGGKVEPDYEQLAMSAGVMFAHYPTLQQVAAIYVWLGHDTQTIKAYTRASMVQVWNDVLPQVNEMAEAHRTLTYPPKPGGMCKRYCPVTSCPYYGKGSY